MLFWLFAGLQIYTPGVCRAAEQCGGCLGALFQRQLCRSGRQLLPNGPQILQRQEIHRRGEQAFLAASVVMRQKARQQLHFFMHLRLAGLRAVGLDTFQICTHIAGGNKRIIRVDAVIFDAGIFLAEAAKFHTMRLTTPGDGTGLVAVSTAAAGAVAA